MEEKTLIYAMILAMVVAKYNISAILLCLKTKKFLSKKIKTVQHTVQENILEGICILGPVQKI
jgi:hypothetical protein